MQLMRAGVRVNSRIPVRLEWSESGDARVIDGHTVDTSPKGCLVIAPHEFAVGQKLLLTNSANQKHSGAILVWRGHQGRTGWELGLELQNPPSDFWHLDF
jgi:hypothetical protein